MRANTQRQTARADAGADRQPAAGSEFAKTAARIAADMRADDVVVLDLRGISAVADYFVIATATSDRQMRAIADEIEKQGKTVGQKPYGRSGYDSSSWLLLDYVDVVIHLFEPAKRRYYDLDLLWGDAPRVDWPAPAAPSIPSPQ